MVDSESGAFRGSDQPEQFAYEHLTQQVASWRAAKSAVWSRTLRQELRKTLTILRNERHDR